MLDLILSDEKSYDVEIGYWKEKLQGAAPVLLTTDFSRTSAAGGNNASFEFTIDKKIIEKLGAFGEKPDAELFANLLAAFKVLLYRYSNQEDICVGNIIVRKVENENPGDAALNVLALRDSLTGEDAYNDFLNRVKNTTVEAYQNQRVPFDTVLSSLAKDHKGPNPLFNTTFSLQSEVNEAVKKEAAKYDISLVINNSVSGVSAELFYNVNLFKKGTIERMAGHYEQLLRSIGEDTENKTGALPMLTPAEIEDIQVKFNDTLTYYPAEKTLVDIFEEQVAKTPEGIALRQHDKTLTYSELNKKANQLAHFLIGHGVQRTDNIGIIATRGFDMIIGMFGIMKAGGAYVPIDPEYPIDRQEYILQNSAAIKVIADGDYPLQDLVPPEQFIRINTLDFSGYSAENPGLEIDSKQLGYTIYTSGSTGRPKGVMIEHHSAVNLCLWVNKEYSISSEDKLLFITSMCFDLSVYDIFGILAAGGSVVIVEQQELMDVPKLKDMMLNYGITFWDSVPTTMDYLVRELESRDQDYIQETLRVVFMSGDWIPVNLPDRIKKYFPKTKVISLGGATEGTVWSNFFPVNEVGKDWNSIPYGRPLANNFFYILNDQLQPQPVGIPGELYIGGVGVARGYANDEAKTNYSFVKDPFNNKAGGRMYRTGDLGRMLPSLNMEFIGRKDNQVKIRGYRIELGEIESVLGQCDVVRQAVVLAKDDKDKKKRLVSYVVGKGDYSRDKVIDFLKAKLPDYMVPTLWMELDELPLTSNNKIDRKSLPDFDAEEQQKDNYVAPRTETEQAVAEIWKAVLKLQRVGIDDNFFDIGGHSLLAVQIMTRIEKKLGKKHAIAVLFQYPTVAQLSAFIEKEDTRNIKWRTIVPIKATGSKMPLYIVHGAGLNVLNFHDLASHVDAEQPVFGVQGIGLDGEDASFNNIEDIASFYTDELLKHNPAGPYAIAGYSIGGFLAVEMARKLQAMGKEVKELIIFDTDADNARETEPWYVITPKIVKRYLPRFLGGKKSLRKQLAYKFRSNKEVLTNKVGLQEKPESAEYYALLDSIKQRYFAAFKDYKLTPLNIDIQLFKADFNDHYNDDEIYLGWKKYTTKEVKRYLVPGNHLTMMVPPNVSSLAEGLQEVLNNA
ncbi:non-ribosomal peptide synthetase [Mucilaginibacter ginsenosidivorans]|uniref:Amino acid adenylation domain-containing protein n=1 Tax=Mucilaginibacter ginsenosidivorans TaxID=398053 RepID=A0A5B8V1E2_9SPHI|nr:non-ribosomal peptide synthetase [Mucilaginibacter ginsenosidivorans]QEC64366.1 amino acid adenylation domain-containing protein [Mucilaginibacter ginsenosidivorans]